MANEAQIKEVLKSSWYSRIEHLFEKDPVTSEPNPKLYFVTQCIFAGSLAGFLIGGRIGARVGAIEHIETTSLEVYQSTTHAQRQYHGRVLLGFVRNGSRFGWRAGLFSGLYSLLVVVLDEANLEYTGMNYLAAGALTGIVYKSLSGWRSMVVGSILGAGLSLPFAGLATLGNIIAPGRKDELLFGIVKPPQPELEDIKQRKSDVSATDNLITALQHDLEDTNLVSADVNSINSKET